MIALPPAFLSAPLAHRGLHDRAAGVVENTLSAALAAADAGYGIEVDLQLSADGEAMVFHDDDVERLLGHDGPVGALTAAKLGAAPLLGASKGEAPPRFAALLEAVAGRAPLLVEIKRQPDDRATQALTVRAAALLKGYPGPAALMSFDPTAVEAAATAAPDLPRGLVAMDFSDMARRGRMAEDRADALTEMRGFEPLGCGFASFHWRDLPTARTEALRASGVPVFCWTTRSPEEDAAARLHADNVTFEGYRPPL